MVARHTRSGERRMSTQRWVDPQYAFIDKPDESEELLKIWNRLAGANGEPAGENDDSFAFSVPTRRTSERRTYSAGLPRITTRMGLPVGPGEFCVVGAREGHGKSAWAEKIAYENSAHAKVFFATLELTREQVRDRLVAKIMGCNLDTVWQHQKHDTHDYAVAVAKLQSRHLRLYHPQLAKHRSLNHILEFALERDPDIIILDHFRELTGWHAGERAERIMEELTMFVRRTNITVFAMAQLSRDAAGKRPHTAQFQDTGRIEQKADRAILLWRPYLGQSNDKIVEIIVGKNRWGPAFRGHAHWDGPTMNYIDMTREEESCVDCCRRKGKE